MEKKPSKETKLTDFVIFTFRNLKNRCGILLNRSLKEGKLFKNNVELWLVVQDLRVWIRKSIKHSIKPLTDVDVIVSVLPFLFTTVLIYKSKYKDQVCLGFVYQTLPNASLLCKDSSLETFEQTKLSESDLPLVENGNDIELEIDEISGHFQFQLKGKSNKNKVPGLKQNLKRVDFYTDSVLMQIDPMLEKHQNQLYTGFVPKPRIENRDSLVLPHTNTNSDQSSNFKVFLFSRKSDSEHFKICGRQLKPVSQSLLNHIQLSLQNIEQLFLNPKRKLGWLNRKQNRLFYKNWVETRLDDLDELPLKLDQTFNYTVEGRPFDLDKQNLPTDLAFEEREKPFDHNISHISPAENGTKETGNPENKESSFKLRSFEKIEFFEKKDILQNEIKNLYYNLGISPLTFLQGYKYSNQPSQDPVVAALIESILPETNRFPTARVFTETCLEDQPTTLKKKLKLKRMSFYTSKEEKRKVMDNLKREKGKQTMMGGKDKVDHRIADTNKVEKKEPVPLFLYGKDKIENESEKVDEGYNLVHSCDKDNFKTILDFLLLLEEIEEDQFVNPDLKSKEGIRHKDLRKQAGFQTRSMSGYQFPDMISDQVFELRNKTLFQNLNLSVKRFFQKSKAKQATPLPIRIKLPSSFLPTSVHKLFVNPVDHSYPFLQQPTAKTSPREHGGIFWTKYDKPLVAPDQLKNGRPKHRMFRFSQNQVQQQPVTPFSGGGYREERKLSSKETGFNPFSMHLPSSYRPQVTAFFPYPPSVPTPKRPYETVYDRDLGEFIARLAPNRDRAYLGPAHYMDNVTCDWENEGDKGDIGKEQLYWSDNPLKDQNFKFFGTTYEETKIDYHQVIPNPFERYPNNNPTGPFLIAKDFDSRRRGSEEDPFLTHKLEVPAGGVSTSKIHLEDQSYRSRLNRVEREHCLASTKSNTTLILQKRDWNIVARCFYRYFVRTKEIVEKIEFMEAQERAEMGAIKKEDGKKSKKKRKIKQKIVSKEKEFVLNPLVLDVKVMDGAPDQRSLNDLDYQPFVYSPNKKFRSFLQHKSFFPQTFEEIQSNYNFPFFNSGVRPANRNPFVNVETHFHYPSSVEDSLGEFLAGGRSSIQTFKREKSLFDRRKKDENENAGIGYQHWESGNLESVLVFTRIGLVIILYKNFSLLEDSYAEEVYIFAQNQARNMGLSDLTVRFMLGLPDPNQTYRLTKNEVKKEFKDLLGIDDILPQLCEIVWSFRCFKRGSSLDLPDLAPKGVVLIGPPGTGKTLLVQALAGEAKVSVLSVNASAIRSILLHEERLEFLRFLFNTARQNAPCLFFVDEIDSLGFSREKVMRNVIGDTLSFTLQRPEDEEMQELPYQKDFLPFSPKMGFGSAESFVDPVPYHKVLIRGGDDDLPGLGPGNLPYMPAKKKAEIPVDSTLSSSPDLLSEEEAESHLNLLLEFLVELDGMESSKGVIVVGATNRPEILDPALTRAGRFNRALHLGFPGKSQRIEILKYYSQNIGIDNISWNYLGLRTLFLAPADLAAAMNESALQSIINHNKHTLETIEKGIESVTNFSTVQPRFKDNSLIRVSAFYQAGKAVCNRLLQSLPLNPSSSQQTDTEETTSQSIFSRASLQGTHKYVGYRKQGEGEKENQSFVLLDHTAQKESTLLTDQIYTTVLYLVPKVINPRYKILNKLAISFGDRSRTRLEVESYLISLYGGKAGELLAKGYSKPAPFKDFLLNTEPEQTVKKKGTDANEKPFSGLKSNPPFFNKMVEYLQNKTGENGDKQAFLNQDLLQSNFGMKDDIALATAFASNMVEKWSFYSTRVRKRANTEIVHELNLGQILKEEMYTNLKVFLISKNLDEYQTEQFIPSKEEQNVEPRSRWQVGLYKQDYEKFIFEKSTYSPEDWTRGYIENPEQRMRNLEFVGPDNFYHLGEEFLTNMTFQGQIGLEKPGLPLPWITKNKVSVLDEKEPVVDDILKWSIEENPKIVFQRIGSKIILLLLVAAHRVVFAKILNYPTLTTDLSEDNLTLLVLITAHQKSFAKALDCSILADESETPGDESETVAVGNESETAGDESETANDESETVADGSIEIVDESETAGDESEETVDQSETVADESETVAEQNKDVGDENISQNKNNSQSDPSKGNTTDLTPLIKVKTRRKIKRQRNVVYTENWVQTLDNSKIPDTLSVTWNDMHNLDRDFACHALILSCFSTANCILEDNREILDFFADYLIRFKMVRPIKVFEIFAQFGYDFSNDQKD